MTYIQKDKVDGRSERAHQNDIRLIRLSLYHNTKFNKTRNAGGRGNGVTINFIVGRTDKRQVEMCDKTVKVRPVEGVTNGQSSPSWGCDKRTKFAQLGVWQTVKVRPVEGVTNGQSSPSWGCDKRTERLITWLAKATKRKEGRVMDERK